MNRNVLSISELKTGDPVYCVSSQYDGIFVGTYLGDGKIQVHPYLKDVVKGDKEFVIPEEYLTHGFYRKSTNCCLFYDSNDGEKCNYMTICTNETDVICEAKKHYSTQIRYLLEYVVRDMGYKHIREHLEPIIKKNLNRAQNLSIELEKLCEGDFSEIIK